MHDKEMSTKYIVEMIRKIYGVSIDSALVNRITDIILPKITKWNNRPLEKNAMIFINVIRFKVKKKIKFKKKSFIS